MPSFAGESVVPAFITGVGSVSIGIRFDCCSWFSLLAFVVSMAGFGSLSCCKYFIHFPLSMGFCQFCQLLLRAFFHFFSLFGGYFLSIVSFVSSYLEPFFIFYKK
jgi:hypothetical protein